MSKNYKWWLNPVWHRMLYNCAHMATVGVKGLSSLCYKCLWWMCVCVCVWSCSPLTVDDTEPQDANHNKSHCDNADDIDTHHESDESLSFSTPTLPSSIPNCSQVPSDMSTVTSNVVCSTMSFSLNSSDDLSLVLVCSFLIFIFNYLFFCLVLSCMGLLVIAKFGFELD